ncbi:hypothetical protein BDR03DRAFT_869007, partial [Suillus americanus]
QCEWEAEVIEYINYISEKTQIQSAKTLMQPCLDSRIPILGPHFLPPSHLHARKCNQSEPAITPEVLYLKPLRIIHPFYYPELARCPQCDCMDGVLWDGWTGTGPRDVYGVMLDEAAICMQLRCESCRTNPTSKKGLESECEHNRKTNLKGHCFATMNPDFWCNWSHWSIPGELDQFWLVIVD